MSAKIATSIVGATGYTGSEVVRLALGHPGIEIAGVYGDSTAGRPIAEVLPHVRGLLEGVIKRFDAAQVAASSQVAFCCLPHGASAPIVKALRDVGVVVFDLSADFRLREQALYEKWYGGAHPAPDLLNTAAYGLVELNRDAIAEADLVAVPGCYPTAAGLALAPLLKKDLIRSEGIVIDAKSGVSGAGRKAGAATHFPEVAESLRAYKATTHRHTPEIEQSLKVFCGKDLKLSFVPHLAPMIRGIFATIYATASESSLSAEACVQSARALYEGSPSVVVLDAGAYPDTLSVRGSNRAQLTYHVDDRTERVIALCAIDNLVKGAAGQALQCFNVRFGLAEDSGLTDVACWP